VAVAVAVACVCVCVSCWAETNRLSGRWRMHIYNHQQHQYMWLKGWLKNGLPTFKLAGHDPTILPPSRGFHSRCGRAAPLICQRVCRQGTLGGSQPHSYLLLVHASLVLAGPKYRSRCRPHFMHTLVLAHGTCNRQTGLLWQAS
jgi:hypothetical protein